MVNSKQVCCLILLLASGLTKVIASSICCNDEDCLYWSRGLGSGTGSLLTKCNKCTFQYSKCPVGKNILGSKSPSAPSSSERQKSWYLFTDPVLGNVKIALNISWIMLQSNVAVEQLHGFRITIQRLGTSQHQGAFTEFYHCLEEAQLIKSSLAFNYDCYGKLPYQDVRPGQTFRIVIGSLPATNNYNNSLHLVVRLPDCQDSIMAQMPQCQDRKLTLEVNKVHCENRSVQVSYSVSNSFDEAVVYLCQQYKHSRNSCRKISLLEELPIKGMVSLHIPEQFDLERNYSISVWGSTKRSGWAITRSRKTVTLNQCVKTLEVTHSQDTYATTRQPQSTVAYGVETGKTSACM
ncbi:unnamed protein product [Clavelina lepadiformis]|uniref:Vitelline envelope sperm lysin receptor n=1 Tax=Clavelina lepadiformis TaxID=159417 RepID=A0ABP0FSP0_CLALP